MNTSFADWVLPDSIMRGLERAGFETPTEVQSQVIPLAREGVDLLVSAATGTGKTAAFLVPVMEHLLDEPRPDSATRALILVPTRELARQIRVHFLRLGSYTRLRIGVITGGESKGHQIATLRKNPEVLVATPGRLLELMAAGEADLGDLEILVLDEADRMLDMGFLEDVLAILSAAKRERQSMLFSATLHHRGLARITDRLLREPRILTLNPVREEHPDIANQVLLSDGPDHKLLQLLWLIRHEPFEKALVFTNTREGAANLGKDLTKQGERAAVLHGELDQRERNRVVGLLHDGRVKVLVATDVAARGLDIPGVERVINFDLPRRGDDYLHRTGRTGRAGEQGVAISLVGPLEWNRLGSIERYLGAAFERRDIPGLKASFKGPTKAARAKKGKKKTAAQARPLDSTAPRIKDRLRDQKNIGKRRRPAGLPRPAGIDAGNAPPVKRSSRSTTAPRTGSNERDSRDPADRRG